MAKRKSTKKSGGKGKSTKGKGVAGKKPQGARGAAKSAGTVATPSESLLSAAAAAPIGISALAAITDAAHVEAQLTSSQCIVWRLGEFRQRVRRAVAQWAQESTSSILPTNTLSELAKGTPWNTGQMARLVQSVNDNRVFEPPFPGTVMQPPSQLVPGSTTVLQWEAIVWRHQDPLTPCFPFTD